MHIGMTTFGADAGRSGIGRYVNELLPRMAASQRIEWCDVLAHPSELDGLAVPTRFHVRYVSDRLRHPIANLLWHHTAWPLIARRHRYDVMFYPAANRRLAADWMGPAVGTVHDLSSLHVANKYDRLHEFYIRKVMPALIRCLTYVITVSESSRRDIVEHAGVSPDRVVVVPNGWNGLRQPSGVACPVSGPYLLYVARLEHPGKNHVRLIRAFERLWLSGRKDVKLVLAGPDRERADEIHAAARLSPCSDNIVFTGYVDDAVLDTLYRHARALVFPSLFEGFGLPLIEAMGYDLPVASANRSSLPEVAGNAALYFDPVDVEAMAACMVRLLDDEPLRAHLVEAGRQRRTLFSWDRTARATVDVLEAAAADGRACRVAVSSQGQHS